MIEILVVLLIVVLLATIALPAFMNQRSKGQDADAKSAVTVAAGAAEVYHQDHDAYLGANVAALVDIEPTLAGARGLVLVPAADGYRVTVASASGGSFTVRRTAAGVDRTCGAPGEGGCPQDGTW